MAKKGDGLGGLFRRRSRHTGKLLPTWWTRFSVDGQQTRLSTRTTSRDQALDILREKLGKVARREELGVDRQRLTIKHLMQTLIAAYERKGKASLRTGARATAKLWTDGLGDVRAVNVTTRVVAGMTAEWKTHKTRRGRPATGGTINRRLALLRRAYRLSKIMIDPARLDITELWEREADPRDVYMPPGDFATICKKLPRDLRDFFTFCYVTGTRRGQAAATKWSDVDAQQWVISWPSRSTKARSPQILALAGMAREIVERRWRERSPGDELVFRTTNFRRSWAKALRDSGFAGQYTFHDTRRAAVTHTVDTGAPAHVAMAVSGHKTRAMLDRYSIPVLAEQRAALERASEHVARQIGEQKVVPIASRRGGQRDA